jgi:hypothetical protein
MSESHIILADVSLELVDYLLNGAPLGDVSSLEGDELLLSVEDLAFLDYKLRLVDIGILLWAN